MTAPGADGAFYRVGASGSWVQATTPTSFSFNAPGKYAVALHCPGTVGGYVVYALTKAEVNRLYHPCSTSSGIAFSVNYDVSSISGASQAALVHKASGSYLTDIAMGANGTISVYGAVQGPQDLVLLALDNSSNVLAAKAWLNVNVQPAQTYGPYTLTAADAVSRSATFPNFSSIVPTGWSYGWAVYAITVNKTFVPAGSDTPGTWKYYDFPFANRLLHVAYATDTLGKSLQYYENRNPSAGAPSIDLPSPLNSTFTKTSGVIDQLTNNSVLTAYIFELDWGVKRTEIVSEGYLGAATSYTLQSMPQAFAAADGYATASSVRIKITYSESNKGIQEVMDATHQLGSTWGPYSIDGLILKRSIQEATY